MSGIDRLRTLADAMERAEAIRDELMGVCK